MRTKYARLNVKHFNSTNYRRNQRVRVVSLHANGDTGVVEGKIVNEYQKRAPYDNAFRKVYAVRVERDVPLPEAGLFNLDGLKFGDPV